MVGYEVIVLVVQGKGDVVGACDLEADSPVKLDGQEVFPWDSSSSEKSDDVLFILTKFPSSVQICEEDGFFHRSIGNSPLSM